MPPGSTADLREGRGGQRVRRERRAGGDAAAVKFTAWVTVEVITGEFAFAAAGVMAHIPPQRPADSYAVPVARVSGDRVAAARECVRHGAGRDVNHRGSSRTRRSRSDHSSRTAGPPSGSTATSAAGRPTGIVPTTLAAGPSTTATSLPLTSPARTRGAYPGQLPLLPRLLPAPRLMMCRMPSVAPLISIRLPVASATQTRSDGSSTANPVGGTAAARADDRRDRVCRAIDDSDAVPGRIGHVGHIRAAVHRDTARRQAAWLGDVAVTLLVAPLTTSMPPALLPP